MFRNIFLLICILFLLQSNSFGQQSSDELRKQQAQIQREIEELKNSLKTTQKNKKVSLGQLALVQKKIRLREQAIRNINDQIGVIQNNISKSYNEIYKLRRELDTLKSQYEKSVQYAYKNRSNYDFLNFVFSASGFNDALKRIEYLKAYRNYRTQQAETIKNTQNVLKQKIEGLQITKKEKDQVLEKQEQEKLVLVDEKKEKDEVVNQLKKREKEINKEITDKAKTDAKIRSAIRVAIDREIRAAREKALADEKRNRAAEAALPTPTNAPKRTPAAPKSGSVLDATPEGAIISSEFGKNKGRLPWPIDKGNIKIHYGMYTIEGTSVRGNNPGLTMEAEPGAIVKAVFEGEVSNVFDIDGAWTVLIRHGKYFTVYSNLSSVNISKNQQIKAGQSIGRASTNDDGNGEIEFLLMQENQNLNPESWIRGR